MSAPKVGFVEARALCRRVWPSLAQARRQGEALARAGWRVQWRYPPVEFGRTGRFIVASVYDPRTWECPGDLMYADSGGDIGAGRRGHCGC